MGSEAGDAINALSWLTVVARGTALSAPSLPEKLRERLKKADAAMMRFAPINRVPVERKSTKHREPTALYFKCHCRKNARARELKRTIQAFVAPLDRQAVMFVDFLGNGVA